MTEFREAMSIEMPAPFWRMLGASAFALANKSQNSPILEKFDGMPLNTWTSSWINPEEGRRMLLKVREHPNLKTPGPATLLDAQHAEGDKLLASQYLFDADPERQENTGILAIKSGAFRDLENGEVTGVSDVFRPATLEETIALYHSMMLAPFTLEEE